MSRAISEQDAQANSRYQMAVTTPYKGGSEIYLLDPQTGKIWVTSYIGLGSYYPWTLLPPCPKEE